MSRLAIFIDGSNFHGSLSRFTKVHREIGKLEENEIYHLDFKKLLPILNKKGKEIVKIYYARSETDTSFKEKKEFYKTLNFIGYKLDIKRRKHRRAKEKGVDMAIAMEAIILAYNNLYDEAILVAQDGDYCQLIREIQRLGKKTGLADFGLEYGLNMKLLNEVDYFIDLSKKRELLIKIKKG